MVLELLFSQTVFFSLLFLGGVLAASYTGTMLALKQFFDAESRDRSRRR
ncbi:hypothetical protein [Natronorubrum bangense]|nr:hypothetical protein [Natronorubrum bangense]